jgi:glycogen debranching enzyme
MSTDSSSARAKAAEITEASFYIPATGPATRPRRTLKHGDTFLVVDSHGDMGASAGGSDGLFHRDTRYLSRFELLINGMQLLLLGSSMRDDNAVLRVDLTNPDVYIDKLLILEKDTLHVDRTVFLYRDTAFQRLGLRNHGVRAVKLTLSVIFDSDFADVFEVRGMRRARRGYSTRRVTAPHEVVLTYAGLDLVVRKTAVRFDPAPAHLEETAAEYRIELDPGEATSLYVMVPCNAQTAEMVSPIRSLHRARRELRASAKGAAVVQTSNPVFNEVLCRSMADLSMLTTETPQGPFPYAGIPWYSTTFGRDGIITALEMLWVDPRLARGVLNRLAALQAKTVNPKSDAEPGKILHEMRAGEMAALGEVPFELYYGSVDATPLFVMLAGLYFERTGDAATIAALWPAIEAALAWIDGPGDRDGDGFLEYARATDQGLQNQGWKDSLDSVFHADGRLADGPIAPVEVQAYVYAAKRLLARCAPAVGHGERASALEREASQLAERFERAFWCPDIGMYALALDGAKEPCRVRSSNSGQVLMTGIAQADRARIVANTLMGPDFFSGWGIRTVARCEPRYNPMSYHNGSIWPHDNALIGMGLARYGAKQAVGRVLRGMFEAAAYMEFRRLPELFCGFQRARSRAPTLYPVACSPQAWSAATPFALLQASLGLELDHDTRQILLRNPHLPAFLQEVTLRNVSIQDASADLAIRGYGDDVAVRVIETRGPVEVTVLFAGRSERTANSA